MGDYKESRVERLYLKVPNTDKLRKNADGRHRHLLADGWREMERRQEVDHIWVRYERTGPTPLRFRLPKGSQEPVRFERRPRGDGRGGGRFGGGRGGGRFGGGRGGGRGPGGGGRGPAPTPPTAAQPAPEAPPPSG